MTYSQIHSPSYHWKSQFLRRATSLRFPKTLPMAYIPLDNSTAEIERQIQGHPFIKSLRSDPSLRESRYYTHVPDSLRPQMFTTGNLLGAEKIPVPPIAFYNKGGTSFVMILYIGTSLSGCPGMTHGGLLATVMDEGLAGCASSALPARVGVTMHLSVHYRKPAPTDSFYMLKARTVKLDGKIAGVEGRIETLDDLQVGEGQVVAEGDGQYLQPPSTRGLYPPY